MRVRRHSSHSSSGGFADTHGMSRSAEYRVWGSIITRCEDPRADSYPSYGGRGIRMCSRWRVSFEAFLSDMGPRPEGTSIDRVNNDGDYEPSNCRWATRTEQARNQSTNRLLEFRGETICLAELAIRVGIKRVTIDRRLALGWSVERAATEPVRPIRSYVRNGRVCGGGK